VATIKLDRLTKVYDGEIAVDDVNLTIDDGEFFVVLGPSGCGKSSLLRMIAGLEAISSGDITVDGRSVRDMPTNRRNIGMMFQQSALYPHLTVRDNIAFPLKMAGCGRAETERRVDEVAKLVGLAEVLDSRPNQLSGGMQQRVAMGRALVRRPTMLLMDEPMSNLDARLRTELRASLALLHRHAGATTVYVTHDQVEAMALGDRAAVMRAGRVLQCATPAELYDHPVDVFVATFLGVPPMNVVRARLIGEPGHLVLDLGHDQVAIGAGTRWPDIDRYVGRHVAVGIRPESMTLAPDERQRALRVEIVKVEHLGAQLLASATLEAHAVLDVGGDIVIADASTTTIGVLLDDDVPVDLWRPVDLAVEVDRLHLFDTETGAALQHRSDRSGSGVPSSVRER
jgi:multiple sugar transport system ATP-binding protein